MDICPSDIALATVDMALSARMGREMALKKALAAVKSSYDIVIIDCRPAVGMPTANRLIAGDGVIIPCTPSVLALRGVKLLLQSLEIIREDLAVIEKGHYGLLGKLVYTGLICHAKLLAT